MKKLFKIPNDNQLISLSEFINQELSDVKKNNMSIVFEINENLLRQLDEQYFFKMNPDSNINDFVHGNEVNIIVNGINFKFIQNKSDD